jgi:hypothetical protein
VEGLAAVQSNRMSLYFPLALLVGEEIADLDIHRRDR